MSRVVIFLDYQNVYHGAREAFHGKDSRWHWLGQIHPLLLGQHLAADPLHPRRILKQVRVYRGRPDLNRDPKGHAAVERQFLSWSASPLVGVISRTLRYPRGWPNNCLPGQRPQEKDIDVALALDFALMAHRKEYDVGILFSTDTDMKPALEFVADLTAAGGARAEVAAWSGLDRRRLAISSRNLFCHWVSEDTYKQVADPTVYSKA